MVKRLILTSLLALVLISSSSVAEEINIDYEGSCDRFNVTFNASGFQRGKYDLKIENLGRGKLEVYDSMEGWKSSFFYLDDYWKIDNNKSDRVEVKIRFNSSNNLTILGKLRNGSQKWKSEKYTISQDCPEEETLGGNISVEPNLTLGYEGKCKEFNATLNASNFSEGVYDVKINVLSKGGGRSSGEIYDPMEGWKSSFYYVEDSFEITDEKTSKTFKIRAETEKDLRFIGKLKNGTEIWETKEYEVNQYCPKNKSSRIYIFMIALIIILILQIGIVAYIKNK